MSTVVHDSKPVQFTLASNAFSVQPLIERVEETVRGWGVENAEKLLIVLRELLFNAIMHGNHNVQSLLVHCRIERVREGSFRVVVQDEGNGFDFTRLDTELPGGAGKQSRRGYALIRKLCRHLEFNASGNRVAVLVDLADREDDARQNAPVEQEKGEQGRKVMTGRI